MTPAEAEAPFPVSEADRENGVDWWIANAAYWYEQAQRALRRVRRDAADPGQVQYAVLCPRDGVVRDVSTPDPVQAALWAAGRDTKCGRCSPESGKHIVVSRTLSAWTAA